MANWTIAPLQVDDIDEFVKCQFLAFVENPLHDVVYPTQAAAVETHRKAIESASSLQAGNELAYFKAVDNSSGHIVGGIKFVIYAGQDVLTSSHHAAGIADENTQTTSEDQYRAYVLNEFLGKRVRDLEGQHAIIDLLFVHPDYSRRGIGRDLVARTCNMADERNLRAIVEASPVGKRTYELCGYDCKETVTVGPKHWTGKPVQLYYWMERLASSTQGGR